MRYEIEAMDGAVVVKAAGLPWWPGDGDAALRRVMRDLYAAGVRSVVLDDRTTRRLAPGLRIEMREWARRFAEAGGGLAMVGAGDAFVPVHRLGTRPGVFRSLGAALGSLARRMRPVPLAGLVPVPVRTRVA